jgi:hypothetical protein
MLRQFTFPIAAAILTTLILGVLSEAETPINEKATPTPTAKPQNQPVVNTSKSEVKDLRAATPSPTPRPKKPKQSKADKGWDGKVQGKQLKATATPTPTATPAKSR